MDEEDRVEGSQLVEVSEETQRLLTISCTQSVSNELRKCTWNRYKLHKVDATRIPRVYHIMKTLALKQQRLQTRSWLNCRLLCLILAPVSAMPENAERTSVEDVREASLTAAALIGNASARISCLRREKLVTAINKN